MTKVISTKSISFPTLGWGITSGVETEMPAEKEAQERILMEPEITIVGEKITSNKSEKDTAK